MQQLSIKPFSQHVGTLAHKAHNRPAVAACAARSGPIQHAPEAVESTSGASQIRQWQSGALAAAVAVALVAGPMGLPGQSSAAEGAVPSGAAKEVQQAYDRYASDYDSLDGGAAADAFGFPQLRQKLLSQARGRVLEVAVGTGLNLQYYAWGQQPGEQQGEQPADEQQPGGPQGPGTEAPAGTGGGGGVTELVAVDLSEGMLGQAQRRAGQGPLAGRPIAFQQADVTALPYADSSFDSVVDTFSLCVFPDPAAALKEVSRVVRPASSGGRVLLLEHSRSDNPLLAAYQDATAGPVAALGKGCVWNQDVEGLVRGAGMKVVRSERSAAGTVALMEAVKP